MKLTWAAGSGLNLGKNIMGKNSRIFTCLLSKGKLMTQINKDMRPKLKGLNYKHSIERRVLK